ncbi:MAG TPA: ABC transporter permease [Fimbriimonadaceae bacterium]|nr:ABC transporter permease [Fimbriimonadaceae bacterium]
MRLTKAILLRLLFGVLGLLFISFVTFSAGKLDPADAAVVLSGEKATPQAIEAKRHQLGLDRPFLVQYGSYVWNAAHGDFGQSWFGMQEPVRDMIAQRGSITLQIALLAMIVAAVVGITLGTVAGIYRTRAPDVGILTLSTLGVTVPNFVLLPILVYLFANTWGNLPGDWNDATNWAWLSARAIPVIVLAARPMALLTRLTRASMIDSLQQEFIKTAVAKGVPPMQLIFKHALRNAILPVITAIGVNFGYLLTGSFVVERAYSMPGLGSLAIEAVYQRNTPVIQATVLVTGALFILINLIVDMILPLIDPRIREAQV